MPSNTDGHREWQQDHVLSQSIYYNQKSHFYSQAPLLHPMKIHVFCWLLRRHWSGVLQCHLRGDQSCPSLRMPRIMAHALRKESPVSEKRQGRRNAYHDMVMIMSQVIRVWMAIRLKWNHKLSCGKKTCLRQKGLLVALGHWAGR